MAGSYNHVIEDDGSLSDNETVVGMLENGGDVYEAIEEMYGMIWELADALVWETGIPGNVEQLKERVELARVNYKEGLIKSPTQRYREET